MNHSQSQDTPQTPRWLKVAQQADGDPESVAGAWRDYFNCQGLGWRDYLDWVVPLRGDADSDFDEFRSLMWRAWNLLRKSGMPDPQADKVFQEPRESRLYRLRLYATLNAYSRLFDEASQLYDKRFRYRSIPRARCEQAERAQAPLLSFMASAIAVRCLCAAIESGCGIASPVLTWEGQTCATAHMWLLKKAVDTRGGEPVELVLCNDAESSLADAIAGGRLKLASGERFHAFSYNVEDGDFLPIIDILKSFYIGETLEPDWP